MRHRPLLVLLLCLTIFLPAIRAQALSEAEIQAQESKWRAELADTEAEIAKWQAELDKTKQGTASLQNDAAALQAKINEAKAFIKQRNIQIEQLTRDISEKTNTILTLEQKIDKGHRGDRKETRHGRIKAES